MIECFITWFCLFIGVVSGNPLWYIASGVFAIAAQIYKLIHNKEN